MAVCFQKLLSSLEFVNRIDAELYRPDLIRSYQCLISSTLTLHKMRYLCLIRSGTTPPDREDGLTEGAILFKTTDVRNKVISPTGDFYRIPFSIHSRMLKTRIQNGDVLLNIVGATLDVIGRSAFIADLHGQEANITQAMVFLRGKRVDVSPGYLFAYLNTEYAKDQIRRYARPTGQYNLNLHEVGEIVVPLSDRGTQNRIEELVYKSAELQESSVAKYAQAQSLLESELGLDRLSFDKPVSYAARFSEVALSQAISANRIDAQCFSPAALQYEQALSRLPNVQPLRFLTAAMVKGTQQEESPDGTIPYVSIKHIQNNEIVAEGKSRRFKGMPVAKQGDLLLAITGATIGKVGIVSRYEELTFSGDMLAITANGSIDPHYLLAFLSHRIGQVQLQRWITGSTNGHLSPHDVGRILIPRLDEKLEQRIASLIKESIDKTHESERLLEQAKHRVEALIEEAIAA